MKQYKYRQPLRVILSILAVVLIVAALLLAGALLRPKYQSGVVEGAMTEEYYRNPAGHDVLMVGDCEVYESISTVELWRRYGIPSYLRGSAQQLVWQSYYLLEDALRYETPKVAVFNVLALKYDAPKSEAYNRMTLDGMRWSSSKVAAVKASMTENEKFSDYLFPLLRFHARWSSLTGDDFAHWFTKDAVTHNGYYMRVDVRAQQEFPDPEPLADPKLGANAMSYLDKMTALCKEKGIRLVLMKAPVEYPHWYAEWDEQIRTYAEENGLSYLNFLELREEAGIDMSVDTYDAGLHLNLSGAEKLADYFGAWLQENCDLPDRRSEESYARVWAEIEKRYEAEKNDQLRQLEQYGKIVSKQPVEEKESNVMKNLCILAVAAALCLTLAACTGSVKTSRETPAAPSQPASVVSAGQTPAPATQEKGYVMVYKNVRIAMGAPMEPIVASLGEPTKYFESESCAFQGLDKVYTYGSVVIRTYPENGKDFVLSVQLKDDTVATAEGVSIGDAAAKVKEAYGEPTETLPAALRYEKDGMTLDLFVENDAVSNISYTLKT